MVLLWNSLAESHLHVPFVQEALVILQSKVELHFFEHSSTPISVECDGHPHLLLKPHDKSPEHCELDAFASHIPSGGFPVEEKSEII